MDMANTYTPKSFSRPAHVLHLLLSPVYIYIVAACRMQSASFRVRASPRVSPRVSRTHAHCRCSCTPHYMLDPAGPAAMSTATHSRPRVEGSPAARPGEHSIHHSRPLTMGTVAMLPKRKLCSGRPTYPIFVPNVY